TLHLLTTTLHKLKTNPPIPFTQPPYIHSHQPPHYTTPTYQKLLKNLNLPQSISTTPNSSHNPPQQSFFPHLKHQPHIKPSLSFNQFKQHINKYITYYNHYTYQSNLKNITPLPYSNHLL
ncbi:IS3 family transposase, partial [Bacillus thuringiensis]|uniref:IS3 family transposase n=1 Tax=Bacillus thuringiensis TaxID=1428 RepID=UPI0011A27E63